MKKHQIALLFLLSVAAAITVACGNSSVPTFIAMPMWSNRTVTPSTPLFTMKLDGSAVTPVQAGTSSVWGLSASADFKTIAYASGGEVWSISPTSGTPTQLTKNSANKVSSYESRISPNGKKIVYTVYNSQAGNTSIWIMNADGSGAANLTPTLPTGMTSCYNAGVSYDGSTVAFACYGNSTYSLFTIKPDGTNLKTVLTQSTGIDCPSFTPNGKQIIFVSYGKPGSALSRSFGRMHSGWYRQNARPNVSSAPANSGVASVNLDGSNPTLIVPATNQIWESEVLNSNLYYVTWDNSVSYYQIFKANLDGSGSASISDGTANDELGVCGGC